MNKKESVTISSLKRVEPVFRNKFTIVLEKKKMKDLELMIRNLQMKIKQKLATKIKMSNQKII